MDPEEIGWTEKKPNEHTEEPQFKPQKRRRTSENPAYDDPIYDKNGIYRPDDYREVTGTEPPNFGGW